MKKLIQSIILTAALALCVLPATTITGCKSTPQTVAFKTIDSVERVTDLAFRNYLRLVRDSVISTSSLSKVSEAHDSFQAGLRAAIAAAQGNPQATAPDSLNQLSTAVIAAIAESKGAK